MQPIEAIASLPDPIRDPVATRRRRTYAAGLCALLLLAAVSEARAGGLPELAASEQEAYCTDLALQRVAPKGRREDRVADFARVDGALVDVEVALCLADFAGALARIAEARGDFVVLPDVWQASRRRAHLEVLSGTARVAQGDEDGARQDFAQALFYDPYFELDPTGTSPKVVELFEASRAEWLAAR